MADADRIAAALNYQQKLDDALAPVTANTRLMRQGENSRSQLAAALANQPPAEPSWTQKALPMEGRATFLPYRDTHPGSVMNERSLALPGAIAGMANAISAPSRAYQGGYDVDESGNITPKFNAPEEAANVAMNVMGGGFGASRAAGGAPFGALGMFIGKSAKNWDAAAATKALEMEKAGIDPKMIWQETGTWKGPEGQWRQEISDKASAINSIVPQSITKNKEYAGRMGGALSHYEGYKSYPEAADIPVTFNASERPSGGMVRGETGTMNVPQIFVSGPSTMDQRSTALHELQHAIQQKEGFAKGGSPESFKPHDIFSTQALIDAAILDKTMKARNLSQLEAKNRFQELFKREPEKGAFAALERVGTGKELEVARDTAMLSRNPLQSYSRLAGEVESRVTERRRNMTPEQRRASYPGEAFEKAAGVPINQLIIRQ